MILRTLATATVLAFLASPALAEKCLDLIAKFDLAILLNQDLPSAQLRHAAELRELAETLHDAGEHDEAEKTINRADNILNQCRC